MLPNLGKSGFRLRVSRGSLEDVKRLSKSFGLGCCGVVSGLGVQVMMLRVRLGVQLNCVIVGDVGLCETQDVFAVAEEKEKPTNLIDLCGLGGSVHSRSLLEIIFFSSY